MKRQRNIILYLIILSLLASLAVFIASCCEDCPTCPGLGKHYKGYAYADDNINRWVYQIDTETDSMIDSVSYDSTGNYNVLSMDVSQDGCFLAVGYYHGDHRVTCIYNAQTLDLITELSPNLVPVFISDENIFIGFKSVTAETEYSIAYFFSLPDFSQIDIDTLDIELIYPQYFGDNHVIYATTHGTYGDAHPKYLAAYDYISKTITDTWIVKDSRDTMLGVIDFTIRTSDSRLYFCGSITENNYNACYDLKQREPVYFNVDYSHFGDLKLTPDGKELYRVYPGYPEPIYIPAAIFIYDADDGAYLGGISLCGHFEHPEIPLHANSIAFTPTGNKAYTATGNLWHNDGTVLVVDTWKRQIIKLIQPELGHYHWQVVIGPKN